MTSPENIPFERIAKELQLPLHEVSGNCARVTLAQANAEGELIVESTDPAHPLFVEYQIQERIFRVMKDYRFFLLCLPAVYGMGCVDSSWDWVVRKRYVGTTYQSVGAAECPWPDALAREMALLIFDLSQVPVLKFDKQVLTQDYPKQLEQRQRDLTAREWSLDMQATLQNWGIEMQSFFERRVPTLYCITNGACVPESLIHLEESIVLTHWSGAQIVAIEEIVAKLLMHARAYRAWTDVFIRELLAYCDINSEWGRQMLRFEALYMLTSNISNEDDVLRAAEELSARYFS